MVTSNLVTTQDWPRPTCRNLKFILASLRKFLTVSWLCLCRKSVSSLAVAKLVLQTAASHSYPYTARGGHSSVFSKFAGACQPSCLSKTYITESK